MKICVISFDFWNYDGHIVQELRRQNIDAQHINFGAFQHKNGAARTVNALSKIFLGKNLKDQNRQKYIIDTIRRLGHQDQILVINPELISLEAHAVIRALTDKYIAYLYDSTARRPVQHMIEFFDEIYSFDRKDVATYGFKHITNYNYLPEHRCATSAEYDLVYLASLDNRLQAAQKIASILDKFGKKCLFTIVGKRSWQKNLLKTFDKDDTTTIRYSNVKVENNQLPDYYHGRVILDLVRNEQTGISFRIFEAMALKKKIITNNQFVKEYDFYDPQNIFVLNQDFSNMKPEFFETPYRDLPKEIYEKYTLMTWVKTIFNLK